MPAMAPNSPDGPDGCRCRWLSHSPTGLATASEPRKDSHPLRVALHAERPMATARPTFRTRASPRWPSRTGNARPQARTEARGYAGSKRPSDECAGHPPGTPTSAEPLKHLDSQGPDTNTHGLGASPLHRQVNSGPTRPLGPTRTVPWATGGAPPGHAASTGVWAPPPLRPTSSPPPPPQAAEPPWGRAGWTSSAGLASISAHWGVWRS